MDLDIGAPAGGTPAKATHKLIVAAGADARIEAIHTVDDLRHGADELRTTRRHLRVMAMRIGLDSSGFRSLGARASIALLLRRKNRRVNRLRWDHFCPARI
jgi:hypothetical protein